MFILKFWDSTFDPHVWAGTDCTFTATKVIFCDSDRIILVGKYFDSYF